MFYRKAPTKIPIFHGKIDGFRFQFSQQNQSIWVNFITTEPCSPEAWKSWFLYGKSSPFFMAARFRSVKYDNLPRYIPIYPHISWENLWVSWENSLKPIHWKRPNRSIHLWSPTLRRGDSVQRVQPERPSWKGERRPWAWHGSKIEEMDSRRETKGQEKRMEPKKLGQSRKPFRMDMLKASGIYFLLINIKHFKHSNNTIFKDHWSIYPLVMTNIATENGNV